MDFEVELESRLDRLEISEVLPDGTYIPDAGARSVLGPLHAAQVVSMAVEQSEQKGVSEDVRKWCTKIIESLDATAFETARIMDVITSLKSPEAFLTLGKLKDEKGGRAAASKEFTEVETLRSKRKVLKEASETLKRRATALRAWSTKETAFVRSLLAVRRECGGIGRDARKGEPTVDVGGRNGNKWIVKRGDTSNLRNFGGTDVVFSMERITEEERYGAQLLDVSSTAAVELDEPSVMSQLSEGERLIRMIRGARVGEFRRNVFAKILQDAPSSISTIEFGTRMVALECGPNHILRIQKAHVKPDASTNDASTEYSTRRSKLLQIWALSRALSVDEDSFDVNGFVRDIATRESINDFERAIEAVCKGLRLRAQWTRSRTTLHHFRVRIFSSSHDGDGPCILLATFEPCEDPCKVLVTPAFGAIVPSAGSMRVSAEDFPGSFHTISSERELSSILCPLLCIRLLEALESAAQGNEATLLDVDRHGFSLTVHYRRTSRHLRAKVWPEGTLERPEVTVWMDGTQVSMPSQNNRVEAWRQLLHTIITPRQT